jgi:hypothetical protein
VVLHFLWDETTKRQITLTEQVEVSWSTKGGRIMEFREISLKNIAYIIL